MDKETLKQAINEKLDVIREQFEILKQHNGRIPSIELDLIMANIREVYEYFLQLDRDNLPPFPFHLNKTVETPLEKEPEKKGEMSPPAPREPEPQQVYTVDLGPGKEEMVAARQPEMKDDKRVTADLFTDHAGTLADKFREKTEPRIADKLQHDSLTDIRKGIGINEKFRFINELFDGSMTIYEESIRKLNDCSSLEDAERVISDLKSVYNWQDDDESAAIFLEVIRRRF